tara:strand:+ start:851 stop:1771 length:921 start_codon:yes stop_codon:yes gene_type:complete
MILEQKHINTYLQDYHSGKIAMGQGIGSVSLDNALRHKQGEFQIINGLDNTGKTILMLWYKLALSMKHGNTWIIYSGENKGGQLVRQLIQFMTGKYLKDMKLSEVFHAELKIKEWFTFLDNDRLYKSTELFKIFADGDYNGGLIDPFTGMNREYTHAANYDFLNEARLFCNSTKKSLYVNTHVVSAAARRTYSEGHEYAGYPFPVSKSESEGGQPFGNRCDNFLTIHRLVGHPSMGTKTMLFIRKIKDTETGGAVSPIDEPILLDFNNGLGFTIDGINPLTSIVASDTIQAPIEQNNEFDNEQPPF